MLLKSIFLILISTILIQAFSLRDTPLAKRHMKQDKEVSKALQDSKVKKCVDDAVALHPDKYDGDDTMEKAAYIDLIIFCVVLGRPAPLYGPPGIPQSASGSGKLANKYAGMPPYGPSSQPQYAPGLR